MFIKTLLTQGFVTPILLAALLALPGAGKAEDGLVIGLIPEENIFRQVEKHRPLEAYLSEKLGVKVKFTVLSKYGDIIDRFSARGMDGAFFGIFTAVLAMEKLDVQPVARLVSPSGSGTATGYIIVRKDSGISSARQMRGKKAVFVDRATATGYIFPLAFLREQGVKNIEGWFSEVFFAGSHDSAVYAVLDGRADVGAVKGKILDKLTAKHPVIKEEILIIAQSAALPDTTLCIKRDMDPALRERLKKALLEMHEDPKGKEALKLLEAEKFAPARREDFKPVRDLVRKAGINLAGYRYR